jgi:hypothetical protein
MINKIKQWFKTNISLRKQIYDLKRKNENLDQAYKDLWKEALNPVKIIEKIMQKSIEWYDWNEIKDGNDKAEYINEARKILDSEVFKNETNAIISDIIKHIATTAKDYDEVIDLRMTINGLELLKERLERIHQPVDTETKEDLYSNI